MTQESKSAPLSPTFMVSMVLSALLASFIGAAYGFGLYLFPLLLPDIRLDLGFSYATAGIITAATQFGFTITAMASGLLRDVFGAARVVIASAITVMFGLLILYAADSAFIIGIATFVLGCCAASIWTPMVEVVSRFVDRQHRGKVLGFISSGTNYGVFINGLVVPAMVPELGWRPVWLVMALITLTLAMITLVLLHRTGVLKQDQPGGLRTLRERASLARKGARTAETPRPTSIFSRRFLILAGIAGFGGLAGFPFTTYFAPIIRDELNLPATLAGNAWSVVGLIGMASGYAMGTLGDKIGIRNAILVAFTTLLLATLMVLHHGHPFLFYGAASLLAIGFFPIYGLIPGYIAKTIPSERSTAAFGLCNATLGVASMTGNYAGGLLQTLTGTFFWTFTMIAFASLAGFFITLLLPDERVQQHHDQA